MNSKTYKLSVLAPPVTEQLHVSDQARASISSTTANTYLMPAGRIATLRVPAVPGARYLITEDESGRAPQQIHARRRGNDLLLHIDDFKPDQVDLIVENFYQMPAGNFAGLAEDELTYPFIPSTAEVSDDVVALADGMAISQVLGSSQIGALGAASAAGGAAGAAGGAAAAGATAGGAATAAGGLGIGALGAGGLAAAALGGGGGGGGQASSQAADNAGPLTVKLADETNSGPKDDTVTNFRKPMLTGATQPGNKVSVQGPDGKSSQAQVDDAGNWTWSPTSDLGEGTQSISVIASNPAGKTTTRDIGLTIWTTSWGASLSDNLAALEADTGAVKPGDNKLNFEEFKNGLTATITLAREPNRALSLNDLIVSGDAIFKSGSFSQLTLSKYTVVLDSKVSTNQGNFTLGLLTPASLTDLAGNAFTGATTALTRNYDTVMPKMNSLAGTWADTIKDQVVNLGESRSGITYTAKLDEILAADLTLSNFAIIGGIARANSLVKNAVDNSYSFVVEPTPNTTGQLQVQLKSDVILKDLAGNLLDPASSTIAAHVSYDLVPPVLTVGNSANGGSAISVDGRSDVAIPFTVSGQNALTASILGQSLDTSAGIKLPAAKLLQPPEGYYTVSATATDSSGNTTTTHQVIKLNRGTLAEDYWTNGSNPPAGDANNQLFINRAGSQTFTGGGGADTYVWLKRDGSVAGQTSVDRDTVTDFRLIKNGQGDILNIADLLGTATGNDPLNLGRFIKSQSWDSDGDNINESTRLLINSKGVFQSDVTEPSVADQIILLQGLSTSVAELVANDQLVWKAFWA